MNQRLRLGIVGLGHVVQNMHLPSLMDLNHHFELAAVCDISQEALDKTMERLQGHPLAHPDLVQHQYEDYRDLLNQVGNELDALLIATPNYHHEEAALQALECGLHVFCEKPLALSHVGHQKIINQVEKTGKVFQVGFVLRYSPFFRYMSDQLAGKTIGDLQMAYLHEFRYFPPKGWRYQKELAGEVFLEKNCHHFDLFNLFVAQATGGAPRPQKVVAFGGQNFLKKGQPREVPVKFGQHFIDDSDVLDNFWCMVEYQKGIRCSLGLSFFCWKGRELKLGLLGNNGKIDGWEQPKQIMKWTEMDSYPNNYPEGDSLGRQWVNEWETVTGDEVDTHRYHLHYGSHEQLETFYQCVLKGQQPEANASLAYQCDKIALAADESLMKNQIIELDV